MSSSSSNGDNSFNCGRFGQRNTITREEGDFSPAYDSRSTNLLDFHLRASFYFLHGFSLSSHSLSNFLNLSILMSLSVPLDLTSQCTYVTSHSCLVSPVPPQAYLTTVHQFSVCTQYMPWEGTSEIDPYLLMRTWDMHVLTKLVCSYHLLLWIKTVMLFLARGLGHHLNLMFLSTLVEVFNSVFLWDTIYISCLSQILRKSLILVSSKCSMPAEGS